MKLKSSKGSVSLFVLIALLFYMGFLLLLYANNLNKIQTVSEKIEIIKSIYGRNVDNIEDVYNRRDAKTDTKPPEILDIPSVIITNVTKLNDSYEKYGPLGGTAEYVAFSNNRFSSLKKLIEYAEQNGIYGKTKINITAYGNNGLSINKEVDIEIVHGVIVTNEQELNTAFASTKDIYIYIANNITCNSSINANVSNVHYKLDLNNSTISYHKTSFGGNNVNFTFLTVVAGMDLTIIDSSNEKNGTISLSIEDTTSTSNGDDRTNSIFAIRNNGNLTIESGTVSANCIQTLVAKNDGTNVNNSCGAIDNFGTVNLNGGNIKTNIHSVACSYLIVKESYANGRGIVNAGTINLNSGNITVSTRAGMLRAPLGTMNGYAFSYAYGILNVSQGKVNNSNNVKFNITAIIDPDHTFTGSNKSEQLDIK